MSKAGHERVSSLTGRPITTVRSWDRRGSIPPDLWLVFVEANLATLKELAAGAKRRRKADAA